MGRHAGGWCSVAAFVYHICPLFFIFFRFLLSLSACLLKYKLTPESHGDRHTHTLTHIAHQMNDLTLSGWLAKTQYTHTKRLYKALYNPTVTEAWAARRAQSCGQSKGYISPLNGLNDSGWKWQETAVFFTIKQVHCAQFLTCIIGLTHIHLMFGG